jgi:hypothetical protein
MNRVFATEIPSGTGIGAYRVGADFADAWAAPLADASLSPTEIFLRTVRATPAWVASAMAVRNRLVRLVGLKDVGPMRRARDRPAEAYRPGDRLGIFTVLETSDTELLMGIDDRHLDVRVSVLKSAAGTYVVATAVRIHNRLGRLYMAPVGRVHPLVVRAMMRRARV